MKRGFTVGWQSDRISPSDRTTSLNLLPYSFLGFIEEQHHLQINHEAHYLIFSLIGSSLLDSPVLRVHTIATKQDD